MKKRKLQILLLLAVAVVAVVLLAANLSELRLLPGQPFRLPGTADEEQSTAVFTLTSMAFIVFSGLLLLVLVIYAFIRPKSKNRIIRDLLAVVLFGIIYYLLMRSQPREFNIEQQRPEPFVPVPDVLPIEPGAELVATPPLWLSTAATIVCAIPIVAILLSAIWLVRNLARRPVTNPLEQLAEEAQEAIEAIQSGADLKDTVMRCYRDMSRMLAERRGIQRQDAMTPREFEDHLREAGLPDAHIQRLTRLFEKVRYGAKVPDEEDERQAIACLSAIVDLCKTP
jgi:hypothetical protein